MKLSNLESGLFKTSSLKSPKTTVGISDAESWFNNMVVKAIHCCTGTLGDRYTKAIWNFVLRNYMVAVSDSIPADVNLRTLRTLIMTPSLLLLSGYQTELEMVVRELTMSHLRLLSCWTSGSLAITDLMFSKAIFL